MWLGGVAPIHELCAVTEVRYDSMYPPARYIGDVTAVPQFGLVAQHFGRPLTSRVPQVYLEREAAWPS